MYSVLESFYNPAKIKGTLLQNTVKVLKKTAGPAVTIGYLVFTNYVEKRLPDEAKNVVEAELRDQLQPLKFKSDFGKTIRETLCKMFPNLQQEQAFVSRFKNEIFVQTENLNYTAKAREMILALMDESFLSNCEKRELHNLNILFEKFVLATFIRRNLPIILGTGLFSMSYIYRKQIFSTTRKIYWYLKEIIEKKLYKKILNWLKKVKKKKKLIPKALNFFLIFY